MLDDVIMDVCRPIKDLYYDHEAEDAQRKKEVEVKQIKQRMTYVKRVIIHPSFKNISFRESEKLMEQSDQGDAIIRPSSKVGGVKVGRFIYSGVTLGP